jgi:hypothetical protein
MAETQAGNVVAMVQSQYTTIDQIDAQVRILEVQQREAHAACLAAQKQAELLTWQIAVLQDHRNSLEQEHIDGDNLNEKRELY